MQNLSIRRTTNCTPLYVTRMRMRATQNNMADGERVDARRQERLPHKDSGGRHPPPRRLLRPRRRRRRLGGILNCR